MRRVALSLAGALLVVFALPARAVSSIVVDRTMDFYVVINEPTELIVETDLCDETESYWCPSPPFTDSVLWLYDASGSLLTVNDDDPRRGGQSWNSYLAIQLEPGVYRLRAGRFYCVPDNGCIHPDAPFAEGAHYVIESNVDLVLDPNPPTESIPPVPSELPTIEPTPTPTEEPTPSQEPSYEPSPSPSPEPPPTPTPTVSPDPSPLPSRTPRVDPSPSPAEPSLSPEPTDTPVSPPPSPSVAPEPSPENPAEAVSAAVSEVVDAAVVAVADAVAAVGKAAEFVANLGADVSPAKREEVRKVVLPAIIISQVAQAAAAASTLMNNRRNK